MPTRQVQISTEKARWIKLLENMLHMISSIPPYGVQRITNLVQLADENKCTVVHKISTVYGVLIDLVQLADGNMVLSVLLCTR